MKWRIERQELCACTDENIPVIFAYIPQDANVASVGEVVPADGENLDGKGLIRRSPKVLQNLEVLILLYLYL